MVKAAYSDKPLIVEILTNSFDDNKSVNYIVQQDAKRIVRIKRLMAYSFEVCYRFGKVFLSDDRNGCAMVLFPDKKNTTLYTIYLDLSLIFSCIGLFNIKKAMARESKIKKLQLKDGAYYIWFIGVYSNDQSKGIGSILLKELIKDAAWENKTIFLETSTIKNIPWYEKFGFTVYNQLDLGYQLFFLKH